MSAFGVNSSLHYRALSIQGRRIQEELVTIQKELSAGKRSDIALSIGSRTEQYIALETRVRNFDAMANSNKSVLSRLNFTEAVLSSVDAAVSEFRDVLMSARSGLTSARDAQSISKGLLHSVTGYLNAQVGGEFIFSGKSYHEPALAVHLAPESVSQRRVLESFYSAFGVLPDDPGAAEIGPEAIENWIEDDFGKLFDSPEWESMWSDASLSVPSARTGEFEFSKIGVSAADPAFRKLVMSFVMMSSISRGKLNDAAFQVVSGKSLEKVEAGTIGLNSLRAEIGSSIERIDTSSRSILLQQDFMRSELGDLIGVDPFELSLRLERSRTVLEASYMVSARLSRLSLANFL